MFIQKIDFDNKKHIVHFVQKFQIKVQTLMMQRFDCYNTILLYIKIVLVQK